MEVLWWDGVGVLKQVTFSTVSGHEFDVTFQDEEQELILQIQMETVESSIVGTMSCFSLLCLYWELS
jgi:hypothetical protein